MNEVLHQAAHRGLGFHVFLALGIVVLLFFFFFWQGVLKLFEHSHG